MNRSKTWAVIWTFVILVLCWTPRQSLPVSEDTPSFLRDIQIDKFIHFFMFFGFSFFWTRVCSKRALGLIAAAGVLLGVLTELGQATSIVGRDANIWDGLADVAGVLIGILVAETMIQKPVDAMNSV